MKEQILIECCPNPIWRSRPDEQGKQLFSEAIYHNKDYYIFPKGKTFDTQDQKTLKDKTDAGIYGYTYPGSEWFGKRANLRSEEDLIGFIARSRADVGIVNENHLFASKYLKEVSIGQVQHTSTLHMRLNSKLSHLLPKVNAAILDMIQDGTRDKIVKKYIMH